MDEIVRRRIECLLESTEEDDLLGGFSSDDNDDNTPTHEPHDQNTDTKQSCLVQGSAIGGPRKEKIWTAKNFLNFPIYPTHHSPHPS